MRLRREPSSRRFFPLPVAGALCLLLVLLQSPAAVPARSASAHLGTSVATVRGHGFGDLVDLRGDGRPTLFLATVDDEGRSQITLVGR
jgi:hypothetical protein